MFFRRPISGIRDITYRSNIYYKLCQLSAQKVYPEDFSITKILNDSCGVAGVPVPTNPQDDIPHFHWWRKLIEAAQNKPITSNYGARLLRFRITHALSNNLAIREVYRLNETEIEKCSPVDDPVMIIGLPRSNGHMAAHVLARSGIFLSPKQSDTFSPVLLSEADRDKAFRKHFRYFNNIHPQFVSVRKVQSNQVDDDLSLHLLTPQSLAWGLLHGLDEYLLECLDEDQTPTFQQIKKVLRLFEWYKHCGHFTPAVLKEVEPIDNPMETQTFGTKSVIARHRWLLHSPLAILSSEALNETFPSMNVIWVHRALAQCVPSLCSSLCLHQSIYTGKPPTESQLATMGEKVLGIFGSGSRNAVAFYENFERSRMVHWSNRDIKRHATRVIGKTLNYWNIELDRYRKLQMVNGQTEYIEGFRPMHDAQMPYFCLHEGIIGDAFQDYIFQFEEFAYEKRLGVTIKGYQPIAATADEMSLGTGLQGKSSGSLPPGSLGRGQPIGDHFLEEAKGFK